MKIQKPLLTKNDDSMNQEYRLETWLHVTRNDFDHSCLFYFMIRQSLLKHCSLLSFVPFCIKTSKHRLSWNEIILHYSRM